MKFILTKELGRFARWLRLLGYDAMYFDSDDMKQLFITAFNERRIVITKRINILNTTTLKVICVKSDLFKEQFSELQGKIRLDADIKTLFTRCAECNKEVVKIAKDSVKALVPEYVFKTQRYFLQCPICKKIYWKATHWDRAKEFIAKI